MASSVASRPAVFPRLASVVSYVVRRLVVRRPFRYHLPMARWHPSMKEFEAIVEEALRGLPEQFAELLENIVVIVEEEPTDEDLDVLDDDGHEDPDSELLGIYRGRPLTERSWSDLPELPDQVAIFRGPILRVVQSRKEAIEEIQETVIHEFGHYFGLDDDDMPY